MIDEAGRLGMDCLVEVHDEDEMHRAVALGAPMIGINNRDLRDLSIDLATTEKLAPLAPGRLLVSESGIGGRSDVDRLAPSVDGFLIGSALMGAADPAQAARALLFGRVKLCGLNRAEDIAAGAAAAFAGLCRAGKPAPCDGRAGRAAGRAGPALRNAARRRVPRCADAGRRRPRGAAQSACDPAARSGGRDLCAGVAAAFAGRLRAVDGGQRRSRPASPGRRPPVAVRQCRRRQRSELRLALAERPSAPAQSIVAGGIGPANARAAASLGAYAIDVGSALDAAPGAQVRDPHPRPVRGAPPGGRTGLRACA